MKNSPPAANRGRLTTLRCVGIACVMLFLLPTSAAAQKPPVIRTVSTTAAIQGVRTDNPVLVVTMDPSEAEKRAKSSFSAEDRIFRPVPQEYLLDQVWVLGVDVMRSCPRSDLVFSDFEEKMKEASEAIDGLEYTIARLRFTQLDQALPCLTVAVNSEQLWWYFVLQGILANYDANQARALVSFAKAIAVSPGRAMDPAYPPDIQRLYADGREKLFSQQRAILAAPKVDHANAGTVVLDGVAVGGNAVAEVLPGEHLLQIRDRQGNWRGGFIRVKGGEVILVSQPENLPQAVPVLQQIDQKRLAGWLSSVIKVVTPKVVLHDGGSNLVVLGEGVSFRRARRLAESAPAFTLSLMGGYQRAERGHYGVGALDASVRLYKVVRLNINARLGYSEPVKHPLTGEVVAHSLLLDVGFGPGLRFELPPAAIEVGVSVHYAPNPDGVSGPTHLVGALGILALDVQMGKSPLFIRLHGEAGNLGPHFVGRGLVGFGLRTGTPPTPTKD